VTGYGPPDDPSEAPTGYYDYNDDGNQPPPQGSGPWYRNPIVLVALGLFVAILLGLAFYLLADQTSGHGGTTQTPTSPTTSTPAPTTTDVTTTTAPVAPPETTTFPPSTAEPTSTAPTTTAPTTTPSVDDSHHHHHHHDGGTP
jgi:cytoskeletal protein RodZ